MPPLRSVTSCSPSASARTVTAHSLKAIGIGELVSEERRKGRWYLACPGRKPHFRTASQHGPDDPRDGTSHTMHKVSKSHNWAAKRQPFSIESLLSGKGPLSSPVTIR